MAVRFLVDYMNAQMKAFAEHKYFLSKDALHDVGWEFAIQDFVSIGFAKKFQEDYFKEHNITALDSELNEVFNGDACLIIKLEAIAHNYETGKEAVLENKSLRYCFGKKENCQNRKEITPGLYWCERQFSASPT